MTAQPTLDEFRRLAAGHRNTCNKTGFRSGFRRYLTDNFIAFTESRHHR